VRHEFTFYLQLTLKLVQRIILLASLGAHTLRHYTKLIIKFPWSAVTILNSVAFSGVGQ